MPVLCSLLAAMKDCSSLDEDAQTVYFDIIKMLDNLRGGTVAVVIAAAPPPPCMERAHGLWLWTWQWLSIRAKYKITTFDTSGKFKHFISGKLTGNYYRENPIVGGIL